MRNRPQGTCKRCNKIRPIPGKGLCAPCRGTIARIQLKIKALTYKGGRCIKCGYNSRIEAMAFHHRDPDAKDFEISHGNMKWEQVVAELDKCDLLCQNCHTERHSTSAGWWNNGPLVETDCSIADFWYKKVSGVSFNG